MATTCLKTTVELPYSEQQARDEMFTRFPDVSQDVRPSDPFGSVEHAVGNQNTTAANGSALDPIKDDPRYAEHTPGPAFVTRNQIPAQLVEIEGPFDAAEMIARCWIQAGNQLVADCDFPGDELRESEKSTLIRQATEKYAFNMFIGEGATEDAITSELGWTPEDRTLEQIIDDETRKGRLPEKADLVFENGNTVQVKVGRAKPEGCTHKAKVTPNGDGTADVVVKKV
jgi:hypothetical protein